MSFDHPDNMIECQDHELKDNQVVIIGEEG